MIVFFGWLISVFFLWLYSFVQIDLGLTLTRASFWQPIQRAFQQIGYFHRPLSTGLYLAILFFLFSFYFLLLRKVEKKQLTTKKIWRLILITALLLWLAYNAFSYDLFNYIFDARIVTFYGQNPYQRKALDFPDDPMLGFMHWTHRYFPYGPLWLGLTIPLSFLGFQKLIPTALLIKGLAVTSYLASAWLIEKILLKTKPKQALLGLTFFAFNPLVVIESLVAAHNDIVMMAFVLAAFWLFLKKKYFWGWAIFFLSVGVKFATILLLPLFLFVQWRKQKINWEKFWLAAVFFMIAALLAASWRIGEIKPWYWLFVFPFIALLPKKRWLFWSAVGLSIGFLLYYTPFFYLGHWDAPVPLIKNVFVFGSLLIGLGVHFVERKLANVLK